MKIYILMMGGFLLSCNTSKLKTKYAATALLSITSDSSASESWRRSLILADSSSYDELWWLSGNARWHPDSGITADELFIRYRGKAWRNATLLDSQQRSSMRINSLQQETNTALEEKQKLQKTLPIAWWCCLLLLGLFLFAIRKLF